MFIVIIILWFYSEETRTLLRVKWRFTPSKVGLYSE